MTGKERVWAALNHREPDAVPVDFGGTAVTGMHVDIVIALRDCYGLEKRPVRIHEPYQMLGFIDEDLKLALGIDIEGVFGAETIFGFRNENWKPWRMDNGTEVLGRCGTFGKDGGFIFNAVHNIQANVPAANVVAMFEAVKEFNGK